MNNVIPLRLIQWANEDWVSPFLVEHGIARAAMLTADPNQRLSGLGSRLLHLATMAPTRPSREVTQAVMEFLLKERSADVNIADDYGRTPLTHFITQGASAWRTNEQYGIAILSLLFEHGADANVYFTPDFISLAECTKWTLAHHLNDRWHCHTKLPKGMSEILELHLDRNLLDSAGRSANPPSANR